MDPSTEDNEDDSSVQFLASLPTTLPDHDQHYQNYSWGESSSTANIYVSTQCSTSTNFGSVITTPQRLTHSHFVKPWLLQMPIEDVNGRLKLMNGERITPSQLRETRFRQKQPPLTTNDFQSPFQASHVSGLLTAKNARETRAARAAVVQRTHARTRAVLRKEAASFTRRLGTMRFEQARREGVLVPAEGVREQLLRLLAMDGRVREEWALSLSEAQAEDKVKKLREETTEREVEAPASAGGATAANKGGSGSGGDGDGEGDQRALRDDSDVSPPAKIKEEELVTSTSAPPAKSKEEEPVTSTSAPPAKSKEEEPVTSTSAPPAKNKEEEPVTSTSAPASAAASNLAAAGAEGRIVLQKASAPAEDAAAPGEMKEPPTGDIMEPRWHTLFEKVDRNADGCLTRVEFIRAIRSSPALAKELHELLGLPEHIRQEDGSRDVRATC